MTVLGISKGSRDLANELKRVNVLVLAGLSVRADLQDGGPWTIRAGFGWSLIYWMKYAARYVTT